ncbi:MAG: alpha/beta hydrolase family protein [Nitrososphaera sp.]
MLDQLNSKASAFSLGLLAGIVIFSSSMLDNPTFNYPTNALAQPFIQTVKHRDLVIDLGNGGLKTNAQLTLPAVGNGPFPGVLLIAGSGIRDMNESLDYIRIDNHTGSRIYPPTPFFQIAEYLSERGFVVLRYDKRGIGANGTILDNNVWGNLTFNDLKQDAEKALAVLAQQPEVDPNRITILGHSEGTVIAPRVAIDNTTKARNLVLMGAAAQNVYELGYNQNVDLKILYAKKVLDRNHDGLLSVSEANKDPIFGSMIGNVTELPMRHDNTTTTLTTSNETATQLQQNAKYNTTSDFSISINNELKPILAEGYESISVVTPGEKCAINLCPVWVQSHRALEPTLSMIGNVSSDTSILILNGENDTQTPVQGVFLLQQRLTGLNHPDHTLITYPNLGHAFYPSSQWLTALGPIPEYVLADLYSWLEAHSGFTSATGFVRQ